MGSRTRKALEPPAVQQSLGYVCCGSCHSHQEHFAALQRQLGLHCAGTDTAEATHGFETGARPHVSVPGLQGYQVKSQACHSRRRCGHAQACKMLCCCVCPVLGCAGTGLVSDQQRSWLAGPHARDIVVIPSMRSFLALSVLWGALENFGCPPSQVPHLQSCHWNAEAASLQSLLDEHLSCTQVSLPLGACPGSACL